MPENKILFRLNFNYETRREALDKIMILAHKGASAFVCFANVHMCVIARTNSAITAKISSAAMTLPDGMPIVLALRILYACPQERIDGISLLPAILERAEKENLSVFFYGSTEAILKAIIARTGREFPRLRIAGFHAPPFRPITSCEESEIINMINRSNANLLLVALGCPKQERWMVAMKNKINSVMIGMGAAFPVYAGIQKRAPAWMQRSCLEWFYRLCREPRRLYRRYLITNILFLFLVVQEIITFCDFPGLSTDKKNKRA
jgi:N-acetylglucosaminyldiphosphoundecaprenol N-acetyl-beta-D-mannosaminyltransferase